MFSELYRGVSQSQNSLNSLFLDCEVSKLFGVCVQVLRLYLFFSTMFLGVKVSGMFSALFSRVSLRNLGECVQGIRFLNHLGICVLSGRPLRCLSGLCLGCNISVLWGSVLGCEGNLGIGD